MIFFQRAFEGHDASFLQHLILTAAIYIIYWVDKITRKRSLPEADCVC